MPEANEERKMPTSGAGEANLGETTRNRKGGSLRQPMFNWANIDKYTESKHFVNGSNKHLSNEALQH